MAQLIKKDDISEEFKNCSMYYMNFAYNGVNNNSREFLEHASCVLDPELCKIIELKTRNHTESRLWYEMRYGRITSSTIWNVRREINNSITYKNIMRRDRSDYAFNHLSIMRSRKLKPVIREALEKELGKPINESGLILNNKYPAFAATPDGIGDNFVVEIKCPANDWEMGVLYGNKAPKLENLNFRFKYQLLLQMLLCEKDRGCLCIADRYFEDNKKITYFIMEQHKHSIETVVSAAMQSWKEKIFPYLTDNHY